MLLRMMYVAEISTVLKDRRVKSRSCYLPHHLSKDIVTIRIRSAGPVNDRFSCQTDEYMI